MCLLSVNIFISFQVQVIYTIIVVIQISKLQFDKIYMNINKIYMNINKILQYKQFYYHTFYYFSNISLFIKCNIGWYKTKSTFAFLHHLVSWLTGNVNLQHQIYAYSHATDMY